MAAPNRTPSKCQDRDCDQDVEDVVAVYDPDDRRVVNLYLCRTHAIEEADTNPDYMGATGA